MIEKFIAGREIQVAIMGNKKLGAIELKPKRKFYDYQAKYNLKAKTKHIIPVKLTKIKLQEILDIQMHHQFLGHTPRTHPYSPHFQDYQNLNNL